VTTAFVFTPDLCTGCEACRVACGNENAGGRDTGWRQVTTFNPERHPALPTRHLSLACNHCEVPACARACPAAAYRRDAATGALLLDDARCVGCRYCSWVCPYDAPRYDEERGVMTKCTFCAHRLKEGLAPACVAACPTGALAAASRALTAEPRFHGLGAFGLRPALVIVPPRRTSPPEGLPVDDDGTPPSFPPRPRKITLASEKALVVFTLVLPALAAWFAGGLRLPARAPRLAAFLGLAVIAFALSTAHLGRPLRAWRAVLGLGTSWLSREVAAAGLFVTLALAHLTLRGASPALGVAGLAAAVLLVAAMDGVYLAIPRARGPRLHGGEAATALALLGGIAAGLPWVSAAAALTKTVLILRRWRMRALGMPVWAGLARLALLAAALGPWPWGVAFGLALASEAIDRAGFYAGLEPSTPASRMEAEATGARTVRR
jgi:Fe-S-cluster-containing dehydrogenase component/DMSO reductase anchor subunit